MNCFRLVSAAFTFLFACFVNCYVLESIFIRVNINVVKSTSFKK